MLHYTVASRVALPIIAGKLNRYKPDCQETAEITMGFPSASCKAPEYPTVRELARGITRMLMNVVVIVLHY